MTTLEEFEISMSPADKYKSERDENKRHLMRAIKVNEELLERNQLLQSLDSPSIMKAPTWTKKKKSGKKHLGIANLFLSDLHLDEVVKPDQIGYVNSYNREIALNRLRNTVENTIEVAKSYISGITYEGITVWLGGDFFSGNIHEELRNTNESTILGALEFWIDPFVDCLLVLADEFGAVHCPGVVGNHGRNTFKPIMKNRVEDNFDWFFYKQLARVLKNDKRFTWQLPTTADVTVKHYDHTYLLTHGDQFRGGSGIAGIATPLALGAFKKGRRQQAVDDPFDTILLGHFHQYTLLPGIMVNGSLKGYDEYASISNFGFEVPQQGFWISTPERGPAFHAAIQPMDRKTEGW